MILECIKSYLLHLYCRQCHWQLLVIQCPSTSWYGTQTSASALELSQQQQQQLGSSSAEARWWQWHYSSSSAEA